MSPGRRPAGCADGGRFPTVKPKGTDSLTCSLARISHKPIVGSPVWSPAGVVRTGFAPFFWLAPCEGEASAVPRPSVALAGRSGPATDGFRPNSAHTAPLRRSAAPRLSALRRLSAA
jgi:hypothetical protein